MKRASAPPEIGKPAVPARQTWVQTNRAAHEEWARFTLKKPTAGALLHVLVAKMGERNAVVISQAVLAELLGVSDRTVRNAVTDLVVKRWIQVVRLGKGRECAYVVNDQVVWGESRSRLPLSMFSATIVADARDQDAETLSGPQLRKLPVLLPLERQLPTGAGEDPPSQPSIEGFEPDLPALRAAVDPETGEIL